MFISLNRHVRSRKPLLTHLLHSVGNQRDSTRQGWIAGSQLKGRANKRLFEIDGYTSIASRLKCGRRYAKRSIRRNRDVMRRLDRSQRPQITLQRFDNFDRQGSTP